MNNWNNVERLAVIVGLLTDVLTTIGYMLTVVFWWL